MYEIKGVYGQKLLAGNLVRQSNSFTQYLNTEDGVMSFIEDMKPFDEIHIKNIFSNKDVTEYFLG